MNKLEELKEKIENIASSYDYDGYYTELKNTLLTMKTIRKIGILIICLKILLIMK